MKYLNIFILFMIFNFSCDSILQTDRDTSPRLSLIMQGQSEEGIYFTFEMNAIENISLFGVKILYDSSYFDLMIESYTDLNNNGMYDSNEPFDDCGFIDNLCNVNEAGYVPFSSCSDSLILDETNCQNSGNTWTNENLDPNGDDYDAISNPYASENNNQFDNYTVDFVQGIEDLAGSGNFYVYANTEEEKISIIGGFYTEPEEQPLFFSELTSQICTIFLKSKPESPSEGTQIVISDWDLIDSDGADLYFGGMVITDTLFVSF